MYIVQVIPDLGYGGAERMVVDLATGLKKAKDAVEVISLKDSYGNPIENELIARGIALRHLGKSRGPDLGVTYQLRKVLTETKPELIHTHRYSLSYVVMAMVGSNIPIVHTVHNVAEHEVPGLHRLVHRFAFKYRSVSAVSIANEVSRTLWRTYGRRPVRCILNGIDTGKFARAQGDCLLWRRNHGLSDSDVVIVNAARMYAAKNQKLLLNAFRRVVSVMPEARLIICGDGPLRNELETQARQLNITRQMRFLGQVEAIAEVYHASDVFCLSSDFEGCPIAIMEAMASGLPCVSTAVGGVPELLTSAAGVLTPPGDEDALVEALISIGRDDEKRRVMSTAARSHALLAFDVSTMVHAYRNLYRSLCRG